MKSLSEVGANKLQSKVQIIDSSFDSSDSSMSEGDARQLLPVQLQPKIQQLEACFRDSFTSESDSDSSSSSSSIEEVCLKAQFSDCTINKAPSDHSFLIVKNIKDRIALKIQETQLTTFSLVLHGKATSSLIQHDQGKRSLESRSFCHFGANFEKNSTTTLEKNKKSSCSRCELPLDAKQDVACFSICEHMFHEFCLMEIIEANKYAGTPTRRTDTVFCPLCSQLKHQLAPAEDHMS